MTAIPNSSGRLEPDMRYVGAPDDPDIGRRMEMLRKLGVDMRPDVDFDEMARRLAVAVGASEGLAMVNFIGQDGQYFAGLYAPHHAMGREMRRSDGWCPHTVLRTVPLPLPDVAAWSRFSTNEAAERFGIQSYLGTPLRGPDGTLGTICVVDTRTHTWDNRDVEMIVAAAKDVVELIYKRAGMPIDTPIDDNR